jgi:hypothetical protein
LTNGRRVVKYLSKERMKWRGKKLPRDNRRETFKIDMCLQVESAHLYMKVAFFLLNIPLLSRAITQKYQRDKGGNLSKNFSERKSKTVTKK